MEGDSLHKNSSIDVVKTDSNSFYQHKEKDKSPEYFSEKAKKMATAVYLVTNLIPQTDPLRLSIREASLKLLSLTGQSPSGYSLADISAEVKNLSKKIVEMLEIGFFSGYISEMNFLVLKAEFDFFSNEILDYDGFQKAIAPASLRVAQNQEKTLISEPKNAKNSNPIGANRAKVQSAGAGDSRNSNPRNAIESKKVTRKEAILSIIRKRGTVTIKDISSVVINCSEKTIQRELMALVESGTLKKTGDRRWSTYSLA